MTNDLNPVPKGGTRKTIAKRVRKEASELSSKRTPTLTQRNNGEAKAALKNADQQMVAAHGTFTKGLAHDNTGRVKRDDLEKFVSAINQDSAGSGTKETPFPGTYKGKGAGKAANFDVPLYDGTFKRPEGGNGKARAWESPISGHTFDLQGPDPDAVAMPPAPAIGSAELTAEMAEVYGAALIRDVPFTEWKTHKGVTALVDQLNALPFFGASDGLDARAAKRRKARLGKAKKVTVDNLLRGSTPGAQRGPYVSQFLLLGNAEKKSADIDFKKQPKTGSSKDGLNRATRHVPPEMRIGLASSKASTAEMVAEPVGEDDGFIRYGTQTIYQRFIPHQTGIDHMVEWQTWLDVQNGANRKDEFDFYLTDTGQPDGETQSRFIATPRDLATYVHFDALYQAYLNACLLMLAKGLPTDQGLPEGAGNAKRDGFATFGGPHILNLVTEVATRALKAVRRQKYNIHLRSRPEAVGAAIALAWSNDDHDKNQLGQQKAAIDKMVAPMEKAGLLKAIADHNKIQNDEWKKNGWPIDMGPLGHENTNALLPMAFPEGSPMHPAYGAGHATVAGACVTMLKAFFEMYDIGAKRGTFSLNDIISKPGGHPGTLPTDLFGKERLLAGKANDQFENTWVPDSAKQHQMLIAHKDEKLTVQGELDKLAANIAIGRNFAGVHFYTDYYESLRMGERIAVGILQEQMLTYREPVSMRFTSFDGDRIMIAGTGGSRNLDDAPVFVWDDTGKGGTAADFDKWWNKHNR